ncbi:MAG: CapA family protein [Thermoleophilia bacterium]
MRLRFNVRRLAFLLAIPVLLAIAAVLLAIKLTGSSSAAPGGAGTLAAKPAAAEPAPAVPPAPVDAAARPARSTGGAPAPPPEEVPPGTFTLSAVGDIVMGTPTYGLPPDGGAGFFADVKGSLSADVVLGNLEGTLTNAGGSKCGAGSSNCFSVSTPPSYAKWLKQAGFTVLNLANNHAYDYGAQGQRDTVRNLDRVGIPHIGRPGEIVYQQVGEIEVALIGFASYPWAQSLLDIAAAKRLVRKADRRADVVVVTFHGGAEGSDRQNVPFGTETFLGENRGDLRRFSHAVIDAGADLVVGHGPHVLRGMEFYKRRLIAYSLGNFGGYKVFSLSGPTAISGILRVELAGDGRWVAGTLVPTILPSPGIPRLDPAEQAHGVVRGSRGPTSASARPGSRRPARSRRRPPSARRPSAGPRGPSRRDARGAFGTESARLRACPVRDPALGSVPEARGSPTLGGSHAVGRVSSGRVSSGLVPSGRVSSGRVSSGRVSSGRVSSGGLQRGGSRRGRSRRRPGVAGRARPLSPPRPRPAAAPPRPAASACRAAAPAAPQRSAAAPPPGRPRRGPAEPLVTAAGPTRAPAAPTA